MKANLLLATGRYREARELAAEARRILLLSLPQDAWQVAAAINTEGAALTQLKDYPGAERLLLESLAGLGKAPIPNLEDRGRERLADLYTAWGKRGRGAQVLQKVTGAGRAPHLAAVAINRE